MHARSNRGQATGQWSSRSIGSKLQHQFFYLLIRLHARWIVSALLRCVVAYYVAFFPSIRGRAIHYISRKFPDLRGFDEFKAIYLLALNLGEVLVDRAILGIHGDDNVTINCAEKERLQALLREEHGLILMTAHVGGWQVAMGALDFLDRPINVLFHREAGDVDLLHFEHRGGKSKVTIIDPAEEMGGMLTAMTALKRGEVLCVMNDRVFGSARNHAEVPFLGEPIRVPLGAFKLATATGSPIAVIFALRTQPHAYNIIIGKIIRVPLGVGRSKGLLPYANEFTEALETFVNQHPFQFFNFYNMWNFIGSPQNRRADGAEKTYERRMQ